MAPCASRTTGAPRASHEGRRTVTWLLVTTASSTCSRSIAAQLPFQKKMFRIEGEPTEEQTGTIADAKHLIFEGMLKAVEAGLDRSTAGVLIDEQFGGDIPHQAKEKGLKLAMPVEKSGQDVFDFQYGDQFGDHIESFDPAFAKVLVRYNPEGDDDANATSQKAQAPRRLAPLERPEVPLRAAGAGRAGAAGVCGRRHGPLRRRAASRADAPRDRGDAGPWHRGRHLEDRGRGRALRTARCSSRRRGRAPGADVACVLLGRGADDEKVDHWLTQAAPVEGFIGFAIGRSIWWGRPQGLPRRRRGA